MTPDRSFCARLSQLTPLVMAVVFCLPTSAHAQDSIPWPRGDRLSVSVGARLLESAGDSVRIEYTVTNAPYSEQAARAFVVRTFLAQYGLRSPTLWWGSIGVRQDSSAASWSADSRRKFIQPGSSLGGFQFAAVGLPEPVAYRVAGHYEIPVADEYALVQTPPSFWVNSVPGFTVGVVPFPADSTPGFLLGRLRTLTDRACELGWVTATPCGTLRGKLDLAQQALGQGDVAGALGHVESFRNDVNALTADAFALLKPNAEYTLRLWPGGAPPPVTTLYLHGSGGTANPPTLSLSPVAPTTTTAKYKDSPSIKFSGGNAWVAVGTWTAALGVSTPSPLGDVQAWVGLKNSDDIGTNFDVRVEVLKNGTLVAAGQTRCVSGISNAPANAKSVLVAFSPSGSANGPNDVLALKVLTRIGTTSTGAACGGHSNATGLRLYFDATSRPARAHWQVTQGQQ